MFVDFVTLLTAFGAGSIATALIQHLLTNRISTQRRKYDERKEAYLGLAQAWMRQEQEGVSSKNMLEVGHWILRCQFVAPPEMLPLLRAWSDTEPASDARIKATEQLKAAMRSDLSNIS